MDRGRLAHYRIVSKLGAGGMGEVYRARDEQLDRDVAVKVLPASTFDDPAARARLVREARAAAALNHPNICTVYEVGEADGQAYIAMELVEGRTLGATLRRSVGGGAGRALRAATGGCVDACARARTDASQSEKQQRHRHTRWPGQGAGLRAGQARRRLGHDRRSDGDAPLADPGWHGGRHAAVHVAGAVARRARAYVQRHLGAWRHALRNGDRLAAIHGQQTVRVSAAILSDAPVPVPSQVARTTDGNRRLPCQGWQAALWIAVDVRAALEGVQTAVTALPPLSAKTPAQDSSSVMTLTITRRRALWVGAGALAIAGSGAAWWKLLRVPAARSLAVLPLENTAGDEDLEYLCDGIAESLIQQVSKLRSLRVRPLSTVLDFKGPSADPRAAGSARCRCGSGRIARTAGHAAADFRAARRRRLRPAAVDEHVRSR